jgi:Cu-Zn family superoxide dismutase
VAFAEAGPHFDPANRNQHAGLNGDGHAGDLGNISVGGDHKGKLDVVAHDLSLDPGKNSIIGKPVVLHSHSDNLTDTPVNGGSGGRLACGVLEMAP